MAPRVLRLQGHRAGPFMKSPALMHTQALAQSDTPRDSARLENLADGDKPALFSSKTLQTENWARNATSCRGQRPLQLLGVLKSTSCQNANWGANHGEKAPYGAAPTSIHISWRTSGRFRKVCLWHSLQPSGASINPR